MFTITPSGQIVPNPRFEFYTPTELLFSLPHLGELLFRSSKTYAFKDEHKEMFVRSFIFLLPFLKSGEVCGYGEGVLLFPVFWYRSVLQYGAYLGYCPNIQLRATSTPSPFAGKMRVELLSLRSTATYRRALYVSDNRFAAENICGRIENFYSGPQRFGKFVLQVLHRFEKLQPAPRRSNTTAHYLRLVEYLGSFIGDSMARHPRVHFARAMRDFARCLYELDLHRFKVDFWQAAGFTDNYSSEAYFYCSQVQLLMGREA
ncbi:ORF0 [Ullucus polerovirus 1]|uniref:ORF0 n=1 Tax=Ullucus polerovirus 1 TaxID=2491943 RepID=A0A3S8NCW4_9VIRU|nr:ORF0 [Ullucus polerovirus 1]